MNREQCAIVRILLLVLLAISPASVQAEGAAPGVGVRQLSLIDETRPVKAANGFAGSTVRRVDVTVWYPATIRKNSAAKDVPAADRSRHPLVIWSHGSYGRVDNNMHLVNHLVRAGYVVAGPDYPLSSRAAYTRITAIDISDVGNQVRDLRFVIDRLLADPNLSPSIDPDRIATIGHSLGAVTSYFANYASGMRDPRIKATVLLGAGDPVQAALTTGGMGVLGTWHVPAPVPVLFLTAEHDAFALLNGRHYSAYMRLEKPKYEILVKGGVHIWFRDGADVPADGSNPDCPMLAGLQPGGVLKGCEKGNRLTTPQRQQEITRTATLDFLDGYLRGNATSLDRLRKLSASMPDIEERVED